MLQLPQRLGLDLPDALAGPRTAGRGKYEQLHRAMPVMPSARTARQMN